MLFCFPLELATPSCDFDTLQTLYILTSSTQKCHFRANTSLQKPSPWLANSLTLLLLLQTPENDYNQNWGKKNQRDTPRVTVAIVTKVRKRSVSCLLPGRANQGKTHKIPSHRLPSPEKRRQTQEDLDIRPFFPKLILNTSSFGQQREKVFPPPSLPPENRAQSSEQWEWEQFSGGVSNFPNLSL